MNRQQTSIRFRADEDVYKSAQERMRAKDVTLPDVMRAALSAIATGDVTQFSDVVRDAGDAGGENHSWLYYKCHELFEYRDGTLYRKFRKGAGEQGTPVYIRTIGGLETVLIQGTNYPLKDVIWLMVNGSLNGEISYRNPHRTNDKNRIDNLILTPSEIAPERITVFIQNRQREGVISGKMRAVIIDTTGDDATFKAMDKLTNEGVSVSLLLRSFGEWSAYRTGIHATQIDDFRYMVSIS